MQSGPGVEISMDSVQLEAKKQDLLKITKIPNITSKIKQVSLDWNSIC